MTERTGLLERVVKLAPKTRLEGWARDFTDNKQPHLADKAFLVALLITTNKPEFRAAVMDWLSRDIVGKPYTE